MRQYEIFFTNEYASEIVTDIAKILGIKYKEDDLSAAMKEEDKYDKGNLFIISNGDNKLIIDCNNKDWIYPLVVICSDEYGDEVNKLLLKWDNDIRKEYGQKPTDSIPDVYGKEGTLLKVIEEYYKIS